MKKQHMTNIPYLYTADNCMANQCSAKRILDQEDGMRIPIWKVYEIEPGYSQISDMSETRKNL